MKAIRPYALLFWAAPVMAQTVGELIIIKETGPRGRRANMAIVGDGYQAGEKALFQQHMQTFANAVVNQDPPLMEYTKYFNIYGIFVASNESGADNPSQGITRDTYFNAAYSATITRLLTVSSSKVLTVINQHVPEHDLQFAVVNSDTYGGSGGTIAVANFAAPEIIAHEVGHSFAALGDEYEYAGVSPWEAPNTTQQTVRAQIRWNPWIAAATPVPTPKTSAYTNTMGLFEGAAYNPTGWYRPKQNCRMRSNGTPFCAVCAESYILSLYDKVSPIDSFLPSNTVPVAFAGQPVTLTVVPMRPSTHALKVEWTVDNALQAGVTAEVFSQSLSNGRHAVTAKVIDTTSLVRMDPKGLLRDSVVWNVDVSGSTFVIVPPSSQSKPLLLALDPGSARFVLTAPGSFHIRVRRLDGSSALEWTGNGSRGFNRAFWGAPTLGPGLYFLELDAGGKTARRQFLILR